ncbi:MAG: hypothetical protein V4677_03700 [Bacteroidota bacterium]
MKKILSLSFIAAFILFGLSCKKKEEANKLTQFDIDYSTNLAIPSASITVTTPTTSVEFTTPNVPTQQATKFSQAGTAQNLIDEIKMTKLNLTAVSSGTATANLDYLKSLTVYIKAAGVGEEIVATKSNIPTGSTSVAMDLTGANIKNYIFKDNIQFRVLAIFDASAATDQTLKMDETVHVSATLLK